MPAVRTVTAPLQSERTATVRTVTAPSRLASRQRPRFALSAMPAQIQAVELLAELLVRQERAVVLFVWIEGEEPRSCLRERAGHRALAMPAHPANEADLSPPGIQGASPSRGD